MILGFTCLLLHVFSLSFRIWLGSVLLLWPKFKIIWLFSCWICRSYELMECTLKVYIYKDGNKPIFHQPIMKDPAKAHLFYMPFSSRMLEHSLYVRNSHNRTNLRQFLKDYTDKISAKIPLLQQNWWCWPFSCCLPWLGIFFNFSPLILLAHEPYTVPTFQHDIFMTVELNFSLMS